MLKQAIVKPTVARLAALQSISAASSLSAFSTIGVASSMTTISGFKPIGALSTFSTMSALSSISSARYISMSISAVGGLAVQGVLSPISAYLSDSWHNELEKKGIT
jgi:hypothetical protein